MSFKVGSAFGETAGQTWVELIAAPNPNEVIAVKTLTFDNLDTVSHQYSFAILGPVIRFVQITTVSKAAGVFDIVDLTGIIILGDENSSLQFRTVEVVTTTESKVTAHFARRS